MDNLYSHMMARNKKEVAVTDEKPEEKKPLECGLCMSEKDKKSGECKFDKSVKDSLTEILEGEETEKTADGEEEAEKAVVVSEDKCKK